jgi:hypothetical protein
VSTPRDPHNETGPEVMRVSNVVDEAQIAFSSGRSRGEMGAGRAQDLADPPPLGVSAISRRFRGRLTARVGGLQSP